MPPPILLPDIPCVRKAAQSASEKMRKLIEDKPEEKKNQDELERDEGVDCAVVEEVEAVGNRLTMKDLAQLRSQILKQGSVKCPQEVQAIPNYLLHINECTVCNDPIHDCLPRSWTTLFRSSLLASKIAKQLP